LPITRSIEQFRAAQAWARWQALQKLVTDESQPGIDSHRVELYTRHLHRRARAGHRQSFGDGDFEAFGDQRSPGRLRSALAGLGERGLGGMA
jgi:hypothetical protein